MRVRISVYVHICLNESSRAGYGNWKPQKIKRESVKAEAIGFRNRGVI